MSMHFVFGAPPRALVEVPADAVQVSPLAPGAARLEEAADASAQSIALAAPPGTVERRYWLAHALRALAPGGVLTAMAPNAKGGTRLLDDLSAFGCAPQGRSKAHHRIVTCERPRQPSGLAEAIEAGAMRFSSDIDAWTQPGVFAWDRVDAGTAALIAVIETGEPLAGAGADFGCGVGLIGRASLRFGGVTRLDLVDLDRRAVACAMRTVTDPRANFHWADIRDPGFGPFDFVVMNPPFHDGGAEDRALGQAFVRAAAAALRQGGRLLMVANKHLPYEEPLRRAFRTGTTRLEIGGYKVIEARK